MASSRSGSYVRQVGSRAERPWSSLKILILCGGRGERLRPLTNAIPKPLININGRPILHYLLGYFTAFGFDDFVVAVGYKAEKITAYLKHHHTNVNIRTVDSGDVDIIARIKGASPYLEGDFIMCYGDTLADVDIDALIRFHSEHPGGLSMTTYPLQSQFGVLELDGDGKAVSFAEKPILNKWINIGYCYFGARAQKYLEGHVDFVEFIQDMIRRSELYGFRHTGMHITVNTVKELAEAERNISAFEKHLAARETTNGGE